MRVLLTGAGGFVGRRLSRYLDERGVDVYSIGVRPAGPRHVTISLTEPGAIAATVAEIRPDIVLHLAGTASASDHATYYLVNAGYAAALIQALEVAGSPAPVLLTGTSAEYGPVTSEMLPITEETPAMPAGHYGISKLAQTLLGSAHARQGRSIVVVRPFNIIGPGMPPHLALSDFARQLAAIRRGESPPALEVGDLTTSRDFVAVDDVVHILWQLVQTPAAFGQIVNICTGVPTRLGELVEQLIDVAGVRVEVRVVSDRLRQADVPVHYGSPAKLAQLVGSAPRLSALDCLAAIWQEASDAR